MSNVRSSKLGVSLAIGVERTSGEDGEDTPQCTSDVDTELGVGCITGDSGRVLEKDVCDKPGDRTGSLRLPDPAEGQTPHTLQNKQT